jgi:4-hydroxy-tetrahydrodipicolinate synthase
MDQPLWRGVGVALVTLFEPDAGGAVDLAGTAAHAARLVELGVHGLLVAGSTGEADALSEHERTDLVAAVRAACPGVPLLAGASGPWAAPAAARAAAAVKAGADAVLVAPPRRCLDQIAFYAAVAAAAGDVPVFAYHFPGVAGDAVALDDLPRLPVAGVKDSSAEPERLLAELEWDGQVFVGSSSLIGYAGALGATGAILAVANAVPEDCLAAWDGDASAQRRLLGPHRTARTRFPHGLKELTAARFGTSTRSRLGS